MVWLALHMWMLLLGAFVIGVATGFWMRSGAKPEPVSGRGEETPLGTLDLDAPAATEG